MKLEAVGAVPTSAPGQHTVVQPGPRHADVAAFQEILRMPAVPLAASSSLSGGPQAGRPLMNLQAWSDQLALNRDAVRLSGEESVRARDAISVLRMSRDVADAGLASDLTAKVIGLTASRLEQLTKLS